MRFDTKRFAFAAAAGWAVWYTICAFLVAVAPAWTQSVFSFAMHYDLTGGRHITWISYFGGLLLTTVWIAVFATTIGGLFNAFGGVRKEAAFSERTAARVA